MASYLTIPWIQVIKKESVTAEDILRAAHDAVCPAYGKERIDEFSLKEMMADTESAYIVKMTPKQRVQASEHGDGYRIVSNLKNIERDGTMHFLTSSQTTKGKTYEQTIQFLDYEPALDLLKNGEITSKQFASLSIFGDIKVYCSCVAAGSWIKTINGYKKIEDIRQGDYVLSSDGNFHMVYGVLEQEQKKQYSGYAEFETSGSFCKLNVSNEHKIPCYKRKSKKSRRIYNGEFDKDKAENITAEDYLISTYPFFNSTEKHLPIGEGVARALGYFFNSGFSFVSEGTKNICLTEHIKNIKNVIAEITGAFKDVTSISLHDAPFGHEYSDIVFESASFYDIVKEFFKEEDGQRKLNPKFYLLPKNERIEFLVGAFLSHGYVLARKNLSIISKTIPSALEIQMICLSVGLYPALAIKEQKDKTKYFECRIRKNLLKEAFARTPYIHKGTTAIESQKEKTRESYFQENNGDFAFIRKITNKTEIPTKQKRYFDLCLASGPHDYLANGYIVSNCPAYLYWGWQYIDWQLDAGVKPENRFPEIRNPQLKGEVCKHLWRVLSVLPFYQTTVLSSTKKYYPSLFKPAKKQAAGVDPTLIASILDPEQKNLSGTKIKNADFSNEKITNKNLTGSDLAGSNLSNAVLDGTSFENSNLTGCSFNNASLVNTNLSGCDLRDASFKNADLSDAILDGADISNTDFTESNVSAKQLISTKNADKAILSSAQKESLKQEQDKQAKQKIENLINSTNNLARLNAPNFDFTGVSLAKKALNQANLKGSNFYYVDCSGTKFGQAHLEKANFTGAKLVGASFRKAFLQEAVFRNANVTGADFTDANVSGVDFSYCNITPAQLGSAKNWKSVIGVDNKILEEAALYAGIKHSSSSAKTTSNLTVKERFESSERDFRASDCPDYNFSGITAQNKLFQKSNFEKSNFSESDLTGSDFSQCNCEQTRFRHCDLTNASFDEANLRNADFTGSDLDGVSFVGADITFCNFRNTNITERQLIQAKNWTKATNIPTSVKRTAALFDEILKVSTALPQNKQDDILAVISPSVHSATNKDVSEQNFSEANLSKRNFNGTNFSSCNLNDSNLSNSSFIGASFNNASLKNANMVYTVLDNASLRNTNLSGANLTGASLENADLRFSNLNKTLITPEQLVQTKNWETTSNLKKDLFDKTMLLKIQKESE